MASTFRQLIADNYSVTAHCNDPACQHSAKLNLVKLYDGDVNLPAFLTAKNLKPFIPNDLYVTSSQSEALGADFIIVGDPTPLIPKLKCAKCGGTALPDGQISAGGALLEAATVEPVQQMLDQLVAAVRRAEFSDADDDRRRRVILIRHEAEYGEGDLATIAKLAGD